MLLAEMQSPNLSCDITVLYNLAAADIGGKQVPKLFTTTKCKKPSSSSYVLQSKYLFLPKQALEVWQTLYGSSTY